MWEKGIEGVKAVRAETTWRQRGGIGQRVDMRARARGGGSNDVRIPWQKSWIRHCSHNRRHNILHCLTLGRYVKLHYYCLHVPWRSQEEN